jgi:hypothetical protein
VVKQAPLLPGEPVGFQVDHGLCSQSYGADRLSTPNIASRNATIVDHVESQVHGSGSCSNVLLYGGRLEASQLVVDHNVWAAMSTAARPATVDWPLTSASERPRRRPCMGSAANARDHDIHESQGGDSTSIGFCAGSEHRGAR